MKEIENGLLSCPFCGGPAKVTKEADEYKVFCRNCGASTYSFSTEEDVINAWNERVEKDS